MAVFAEYADFYDLYYADKDYGCEVDFVLRLAGGQPRTLLDMGCGTGRHLVEFLKRGLTADGFDLSEEMLARARQRLTGQPVSLSQGNLVDFANGKQYDLVVSMFAVMGYLVTNEQLVAGLQTARKHLRPGGAFVFDGWFGPAVLSEKPTLRRHEYQRDGDRVIRAARPELDPVAQQVTVHYDIIVERGAKVVRQIQEHHRMRFMFVQEMALAMEVAGLRLVKACPFLQPADPLTTHTWNVCFVATPR